MKRVSRPFEILGGGYSIVLKDNEMQNIFGSREKAERFAAEDRRMHRSAYRALPTFCADNPERN